MKFPVTPAGRPARVRSLRAARAALVLGSVPLLALALARLAVAHPSSGIVADSTGHVYFADERRNIVWRIDGENDLTPLVTDVHSHLLALGAHGEVFGEHLRYIPIEARWVSSLWRADPTGNTTVIYGPAAGFPPGLAMDPAGNRYEIVRGESPTRTSRIVRRGSDGKTTTLAGGAWGDRDGRGAEARLGNVVALAWGPREALYFTDGGSVRKVTMDGWVTTVARVLAGVPDRELPDETPLWGLTVGPSGEILVANYARRRVLEIGPSGPPREILRSESPWSPTGVAKARGRVFVLEHGFRPPKESLGPRVREVLPDGSARVLATVRD